MFVISQFILHKSNFSNLENTSTYSIALGLIVYLSIYLYILFYNADLIYIFNKFIIFIVGIDLLFSTLYYNMNKNAIAERNEETLQLLNENVEETETESESESETEDFFQSIHEEELSDNELVEENNEEELAEEELADEELAEENEEELNKETVVENNKESEMIEFDKLKLNIENVLLDNNKELKEVVSDQSEVVDNQQEVVDNQNEVISESVIIEIPEEEIKGKKRNTKRKGRSQKITA